MLVSYFGIMAEKDIFKQGKQIFAVTAIGDGDDSEDDVGGDDDDVGGDDADDGGDDDDVGGHLVGKGEVWVEDVAHSQHRSLAVLRVANCKTNDVDHETGNQCIGSHDLQKFDKEAGWSPKEVMKARLSYTFTVSHISSLCCAPRPLNK